MWRLFISFLMAGAEGCIYGNVEMVHLFCILTHIDSDFCPHGSVKCYKVFFTYQGCFVFFQVLLGFGKIPSQVIVYVLTE